MSFEVRPAGLAEVSMMLDWAAEEGWNPGEADAAAFHTTDPAGFLIAAVDGRPAACISVVAYDETFSFLGFYIVRPDFRGKGYGLRLWQAGMNRLGLRTVGLDGVIAQQRAYSGAGFVFAHRNIRYGGVPKPLDAPASDTMALTEIDAAELAAFDARYFNVPRPAFVQAWRQGEGRWGRAVRKDGALAGYGVIRRCRNGFKIGPVFAGEETIARQLINALISELPADTSVFIDPPEPNRSAVALAEAMGLAPVFETARMYKGHSRRLDLAGIYGITTFELG